MPRRGANVRYSTFRGRKKAAGGATQFALSETVRSEVLLVPLSVRQPDVFGGARMGDEGKAVGFAKLTALLSEPPPVSHRRRPRALHR
jgi:hypothetical protein